MSGSVFKDRSVLPDTEALTNVLGETASCWNKLRNDLEDEFGELVEDWKFYGQKSGWTLKLLRKKRNLFFVLPQEGSFQITFVFGDRAVAEVEKSDLPESIKEALRNARKYAEGRGLQIKVTTPEDVNIVEALVRIKVHN